MRHAGLARSRATRARPDRPPGRIPHGAPRLGAGRRGMHAARPGRGVLGVPLLVTEQYPRGFGHTAPEVAAHFPVRPRRHREDDDELLWRRGVHRPAACESSGRRCWLPGIETHACVNQTVHDLARARLPGTRGPRCDLVTPPARTWTRRGTRCARRACCPPRANRRSSSWSGRPRCRSSRALQRLLKEAQLKKREGRQWRLPRADRVRSLSACARSSCRS